VKRPYFLEGDGFGEEVGFAFEVDFGLGEGEVLALELFLAVGVGDGLAIGASFSAVAFAADNFTHCGSSLFAGFEQ
jgi:hypothetical protein